MLSLVAEDKHVIKVDIFHSIKYQQYSKLFGF